MKVLVAHNEYSSAVPSGENIAVQRQIAALRDAGVDVVPYVRSSDDIATAAGPGRVRTTASALGASASRLDLQQLLRRERPDIVHLHNPFPLISPRVIAYAHAVGVPVIQTVHNYRHECINGTFFRDGADCTDCVPHTLSHPGVQHACYRGSRAQSGVMTAAQVAYRRAFRRLDRVVALTPALVAHLRGYGLPADRISIVPNTVPDPGPPPTAAAGSGVLFAGRLGPEKGLSLLAAAWDLLPEHAAGTLTIAGDGAERAVAIDLAARRPDVRFLGPVPPATVSDLLRGTALVVVPSVWREVCPLIVIEALAHGRPVLATDRGGLPHLVGPDGGWVVPATPMTLRDGLLAGSARAADAGPAARARYLRELTPEAVTRELLLVYERTHRATALGQGARHQPG